jgi:hypothetical protein
MHVNEMQLKTEDLRFADPPFLLRVRAADRRICGVVAWVAGGDREAPRERDERRKDSTAGKPAVAPRVRRNAAFVAWRHGLLVDAGNRRWVEVVVRYGACADGAE